MVVFATILKTSSRFLRAVSTLDTLAAVSLLSWLVSIRSPSVTESNALLTASPDAFACASDTGWDGRKSEDKSKSTYDYHCTDAHSLIIDVNVGFDLPEGISSRWISVVPTIAAVDWENNSVYTRVQWVDACAKHKNYGEEHVAVADIWEWWKYFMMKPRTAKKLQPYLCDFQLGMRGEDFRQNYEPLCILAQVPRSQANHKQSYRTSWCQANVVLPYCVNLFFQNNTWWSSW